MRARRTATVAAVALLTALAVGIPADAALAATPGTPPSALPDCGPGGERGGWALRDSVATGTSVEDPADVRPRTLRLGEPCVVGGGLTIPATLTDLPVPMLDTNADGQDDGPPDPGAGGIGGEVCNPVTPTRCVEVISSFYHDGTTLDRTVICVAITGTPVDTGVYYSLNTSTSGTASSTAFSTNLTGTTGGTSWSCPGGSTHSLGVNVTNGSGTHFDAVLPVLGQASPSSGQISSCFAKTDPRVCGYGLLLEEAVFTPGTAYYGGTQGAQFVVPADDSYTGSGGSYIYCATTPATAPTITLEVGSPFGAPIGFSDEPPILDDGVAVSWTTEGTITTGAEAADCPYIVSMLIVVCVYVGHDPDEYGCTDMQWISERFNEGRTYSGSEGGTPEESMCALYPATEGCYEVLNPPRVDGSDFDVVCADPPALEGILDFTWLPEVIGHYAECLFVPVNGWDANGRIAEAADSVLIDDVFDGFWVLADALWIDPNQCGNLIGPVPDGPLQGFAVDTCDLGSQWTPLRTALEWGVWIVGGFFVVTFIWNNWVAFFFNVGKLPFAGKDDD